MFRRNISLPSSGLNNPSKGSRVKAGSKQSNRLAGNFGLCWKLSPRLHVRAQQFHSVPRDSISLPAPYIIRNFRLADYSACHLLSRCYPCSDYSTLKTEAICSSETSVDFFNGLHGVISQNMVLFKVVPVLN
jgi:hypothetical protein